MTLLAALFYAALAVVVYLTVEMIVLEIKSIWRWRE